MCNRTSTVVGTTHSDNISAEVSEGEKLVVMNRPHRQYKSVVGRSSEEEPALTGNKRHATLVDSDTQRIHNTPAANLSRTIITSSNSNNSTTTPQSTTSPSKMRCEDSRLVAQILWSHAKPETLINNSSCTVAATTTGNTFNIGGMLFNSPYNNNINGGNNSNLTIGYNNNNKSGTNHNSHISLSSVELDPAVIRILQLSPTKSTSTLPQQQALQLSPRQLWQEEEEEEEAVFEQWLDTAIDEVLGGL